MVFHPFRPCIHQNHCFYLIEHIFFYRWGQKKHHANKNPEFVIKGVHKQADYLGHIAICPVHFSGHIAICPIILGILQYAQSNWAYCNMPKIFGHIAICPEKWTGHIEKSDEYVAIRETI